MKTLILTGWGWREYSVSAAVALKSVDGDADVIGMSRRRLPEFLESYSQKHKRIILSCSECSHVSCVVFRVALRLIGVLVLLVNYYHSEIFHGRKPC